MGDLFDWMAGKLWDAVRDLRIAGGRAPIWVVNREGAIDRQIYCTTPALTLASLAPRFLEKDGEYDSEKALQPAQSLETVLRCFMASMIQAYQAP
ncbi:hypothetical protein E4U44_004253 [Claviceps purpurea]|nr:hypothetical protein E4U44_004253 [Claviceps purpurea]